MNKRQWLILAGGGAAITVLLALGASSSRPTVGPVVQQAPGLYSQYITAVVVPLWAVASCLGVLVLTGSLVYRSRS